MARTVAGTGARGRHLRYVPIAILLVVLILATIPSVRAESLDEALVSAYFSNPQLQAQRASTRATDENEIGRAHV